VMQGARGKTLDNIGRMLFGNQFNESMLEATEQQFKHQISTIIEDNAGLCDMANLIYGQQGFTIKPAFQEKLSKVFGNDGLKQLDLAKQGAQVINADVERATRGMIKEIIDEIDEDVVLILINALYFKGSWKKAFDEYKTSLEYFTLESGRIKQVWMMHDGKGWLIYGNPDDYYDYCRLPCGVESTKKHLDLKAKAALLEYRASSSQSSSKSIQMLIILPDKGVSLASIEQQLNTEMLIDLLSSGMCEEVKVSLPKFKIQGTHDLKSIISTLGAGDLFDPEKSDLTGISEKKPLCVSQAIQKAMIEVDEQGTTATAVTSMLNLRPVSMPRIPLEFVCDRPFWFSLLTDEGAKKGKPPVILFTGSVRDPSQSFR